MEVSEYICETATEAVVRKTIPTGNHDDSELPLSPQFPINHIRPATRTPWQDRLAELANLASASLGMDSRESNAGPLIHQHLDAIETILRDPRPEITEEVSKCTGTGRRRSFRTRSLLGDQDAAELQEPDWLAKCRYDERRRKEMSAELSVLLGEVTTLTGELQKRRQESVQIRELYEDKCRGLKRTVAELEHEVSELRSDLAEDEVELEGIQGTVHGLQHWIEGMRQEQKQTRATRLLHKKAKRRWGGRVPIDEGGETDGEVVLDGLSAWMRGWRDVEDGFKIRARGRRNRRDQRQRQLIRQD